MKMFSSRLAWSLSGFAAIGLIALCGSARADVLFDSLDSPNTGAFSTPALNATFSTGASSLHATDIALLLGLVGTVPPFEGTFTVSLEGGVPLADVSFDPVLGLNVGPGGPALATATLPLSDLSTSLTTEHFNQFAGITLNANSLYWIDVEQNDFNNSAVNWGFTSDVSGVGVADNYNSSNATDFTFFRNQGVPPFPFNVAFQMEVSGVATPEPSTWALMLMGLAGLGYVGHRKTRQAKSTL
jgi:PEP-CTERM motif